MFFFYCVNYVSCLNFFFLAIYVIMFGYFFTNGVLHDYFYWPYLVEFCLPAIRIFLIGHWGQHLERVVSFLNIEL